MEKFKVKSIDFNAPHVVFISITGKLSFSEVSEKYHEGAKEVLKYTSNFQEAADFVEEYKKNNPSNVN